MKIKKKITMLLAAMLTLAFSMTLLAAVTLPSISSGRPVFCYTLKSSGRVYAYTAANLRTKTGGYIDCPTDECRILKISGNAVQVKYPVSGGTRTAWFARNEFTTYNIANGTAEKWTQKTKATSYKRADGKDAYGSISAGDVCYKLSESGSYIQVIYPVSGGYKMGWIAKDDFAGAASSQNSSSQPVPNGLYKVVSMINKQYVWDIYDGSKDNGGNLRLWKDNGTNAQKFMFTYNSDGYYTITNANSNKAIDCAGGKSADGTNIQQYTLNHSDAQKWKLTSAGNGYYTFLCKGNGKMIDVSGGSASNGANIQLYQSNGSRAQKFALVKTAPAKGSSNSSSFTSFSQHDKRWADVSYGKGSGGKKATLSSSGCGILAYVNAVYYMTGNFIEPSYLAKWSVDNGYRINGSGTSPELYRAFADKYGGRYGFQYSGSKSSVRDARSHLQNGGTAIIRVPGHLMALAAYNKDTGKYLILDSYESANRGTKGTGYRWLKESEFTRKLKVSYVKLLAKK